MATAAVAKEVYLSDRVGWNWLLTGTAEHYTLLWFETWVGWMLVLSGGMRLKWTKKQKNKFLEPKEYTV